MSFCRNCRDTINPDIKKVFSNCNSETSSSHTRSNWSNSEEDELPDWKDLLDYPNSDMLMYAPSLSCHLERLITRPNETNENVMQTLPDDKHCVPLSVRDDKHCVPLSVHDDKHCVPLSVRNSDLVEERDVLLPSYIHPSALTVSQFNCEHSYIKTGNNSRFHYSRMYLPITGKRKCCSLFSTFSKAEKHANSSKSIKKAVTERRNVFEKASALNDANLSSVKSEPQSKDDKVSRLPVYNLSRPLVNMAKVAARKSRKRPADEGTCKICEKFCPRKLAIHVLTHTNVKLPSCNICGKAFAEKRNVDRHMLLHTGIKPYMCDRCGRLFTQKVVLVSHRATHEMKHDSGYTCTKCTMTLRTRRSYKTHMRLAHSDTELSSFSEPGECPSSSASCICSECGKCFSSGALLKKHERMHTGNQVKCETCGKLYFTKGALNFHMKSHSGVRSYKCAICEKSFFRKIDLTIHMRCHSGEKPYKCSMCGKSFSQAVILRQHMNSHYGIKPYSCKFCKKSFGQMHHLNAHIRSHTNERPFICQVCSRSYKSKIDLKLHRVRVHGSDEHMSKCYADRIRSRKMASNS